MMKNDKIIHTFSEQGLLSRKIKGFRPRAAQLEMALAVGKAINFATSVVVEAGTGTGKTFSYLVPALLSGKKQSFRPVQKIYKINCLNVIYPPFNRP